MRTLSAMLRGAPGSCQYTQFELKSTGKMTYREWLAAGKSWNDWMVSPDRKIATEKRFQALIEKRERDKQRRKLIHERSRPNVHCKSLMYSTVHRMLRASQIKKMSKSCQYLGCSPGFLRNHLESLFKPGMTWENRGIAWEVDHVVPLSWWDLSHHPEHLFVASHWTNLQPLWKVDNRKKKALFSS